MMTILNLDIGITSNSTFAKGSQDMISYGLFSHCEALVPMMREI